MDTFKRLDHVALVVHNIDACLQTYVDLLGFSLLERIAIPDQGVEAVFLNAGNSTVELIAPTSADSGVARYLQDRGEGIHHICFEVDDLMATLHHLRAQGVKLIDETPRPGVHGLIAFVHPKAAHGTLIELLQKHP